MGDFSDRVRELRKRLGGDMKRTAEALGVSRQTLYASLKGTEPVSGKTLAKLEAAERKHVSDFSDGIMEESPALYTVAAGMTRPMIEQRVRAYLDVAETVPGGLGYAWGQVSTHLNPQSLAALRPGHTAAEAALNAAAMDKLAELKARAAASENSGLPVQHRKTS